LDPDAPVQQAIPGKTRNDRFPLAARPRRRNDWWHSSRRISQRRGPDRRGRGELRHVRTV